MQIVIIHKLLSILPLLLISPDKEVAHRSVTTMISTVNPSPVTQMISRSSSVIVCSVHPVIPRSLLTSPHLNPHSSPLVHRNMPKEQALDFVEAEYRRGSVKDSVPRDPADVAAQASQLLGDFLDREKIERHSVPSETRQLLMLFAEGVHLYQEELETISEYVRSRQEHLQGDKHGSRPPVDGGGHTD